MFEDPALLLSLAFIGVFVGFLTGLFGIGGAFVTVPLMVLLAGVDWSIAVGCSLAFTVGTGLLGVQRHFRAGNVEWRSMIIVGIGASLGTYLGYLAHGLLVNRTGDWFDPLMTGLFVVLLFVVAGLIWRRQETRARPALLSRVHLPPMIELPNTSLPRVSLIGLLIAGICVGILKGLLGLGGGVILIPILVLIVGLTPHMAVGTSLGTIFLSSVVGALLYAKSGHVNLFFVFVLLLGSLGGVFLGAKACQRINGPQLQRAFAVIVILVAAFLACDLTYSLIFAEVSVDPGLSNRPPAI